MNYNLRFIIGLNIGVCEFHLNLLYRGKFFCDQERLVEVIMQASDGGPSVEPHHEPQGSPISLSIRSQVKEMVQALLHQLSDPPGYSPTYKPDFVYLLEGDPEGVIFCTSHSHQA